MKNAKVERYFKKRNMLPDDRRLVNFSPEFNPEEVITYHLGDPPCMEKWKDEVSRDMFLLVINELYFQLTFDEEKNKTYLVGMTEEQECIRIPLRELFSDLGEELGEDVFSAHMAAKELTEMVKAAAKRQGVKEEEILEYEKDCKEATEWEKEYKKANEGTDE